MASILLNKLNGLNQLLLQVILYVSRYLIVNQTTYDYKKTNENLQLEKISIIILNFLALN